ncbi:MAG TPA: bifunctional ADP-dependent NAD(P)H-hydrate dehydratase/NAD(P)H-hydrate epimerase [Propionibacterium sp.]|nr:bifunctional ADP-dependent NAD(P)H-hydrate dehydratase/NAD(P)H-hydrate epimerase [Propionibacterium sp.]
MEPIASAQSIRDAEAAWFAAHPGGDLMGVAASAVARASIPLLAGREHLGVLVVAGPGNNAGDALFAAAELPELLGRPVPLWVWPIVDTTHADGLAAALDEGAVVVDAAGALTLCTGAGLVIDGVSGLGGKPGLPDAVAAVARAAHEARVPVVAVDIPSGLVADSCRAHDSFVADVTVTFIARKLAHVAEPAASACGRVELVDIGVAPTPVDLWRVTGDDLRAWYPWPDAGSDKYSRGVVGVDTGTETYPGAALLGVSGALHAGAGMVRYAGPARDQVLRAFPSVVAPLDPTNPGRVQAWVCGSGWPSADAERLARRVADWVPLVLDAGALGALPDELPSDSVLTPHAGELARLLGIERAEVEDDPLTHARRAAADTGACVLLKGATQYAVAPDGTAILAQPGPAWTATAGSGDVLAGMVGTFLAAGVPTLWAAALAASLQARAAAAMPGPHTPEELAAHSLPSVIASLPL